MPPTGQYNVFELSTTSTVGISTTATVGVSTTSVVGLTTTSLGPVVTPADGLVPTGPPVVAIPELFAGAGTFNQWALVNTLGDGDNGQRTAATSVTQFNGATFDRVRVANKFTTFSLAATSSALTVWTPAAGKKFRLMGFVISASSAGDVLFQDSTAPASATPVTIFRYPTGQGAGAGITAGWPPPIAIGNGILSASTNKLLTLTPPTTTATLSGTVWGTEE